MLRKVVADQMELGPVGSGRERGHKFRGALSLEKLIAGEATMVERSGSAAVSYPGFFADLEGVRA